MTTTIVSCDDVSFGYDGSPVLVQTSFTVEVGEFIGMIGPNGGGKTTLLKLILGFLQPNTGTMHVFGKRPQDVRERMAYVPQKLDFDKFFPISVLELVLMGRLSYLPWHGKFRSEDRDAAFQALERVGLTNLAYRQFGSLSSGQAQRVLIARALVSNPQLLLLDEPTASVDIQSEENIREILQELRGNITMIMVTHNLEAIINDVQKVLCVEGKAVPLELSQVCEHFSYGLYHPPMVQKNSGSQR